MIPSVRRPADRSISRLSYEDIWRNDYENLTIADRIQLVQAILADLAEMDPAAFTDEVPDPIYAYRCIRHCHANIRDVE